jgi:hypothetical protein
MFLGKQWCTARVPWKVGTIYDDIIVSGRQVQVILGIHIYHIDLFIQLLTKIDMIKVLQSSRDHLRSNLYAINPLRIVSR